MAPTKAATKYVSSNGNDDNKITEYFKVEKRKSKAKNPLTEEQKLKRFKVLPNPSISISKL